MDVDLNLITYRQELFSKTIISHFMLKLQKYKNIMLKHGINISDSECENTLHQSKSFEDNIELVLKENSSSIWSCKSFLKIGTRLSTVKLFQWIYQVVQRTKAARVLSHVNDVTSEDVRGTLKDVALEMSISYEHQLMVLYGDAEVIRLAKHAVSCMMAYLNTSEACFTASDLIIAVLEVKPHTGRTNETLQTREVQYGDQTVCLRWYLRQILKQTGLRVEVPASTNTVDEVVHISDNSDNLSSQILPVSGSIEGLEILAETSDQQPSQDCSSKVLEKYSTPIETILQNEDTVDGCTSDAELDDEARKPENIISEILNTNSDSTDAVCVPSDNTDSSSCTSEAGNRDNRVSKYSIGPEYGIESEISCIHTNGIDVDSDSLPENDTALVADFDENAFIDEVDIGKLSEDQSECSVAQSKCKLDDNPTEETISIDDGTNISSESNMEISNKELNKIDNGCNSAEEVKNNVNTLKNMTIDTGNEHDESIDSIENNGDIIHKNGKENEKDVTDSSINIIMDSYTEIEPKAGEIVNEINTEVNEDSISEDGRFVNMRTISAIDMDFETGKMHITEHIIEILSDSSSIENMENNSTNMLGNCYTDAELSSPLSEQLADILDETSIDVTDTVDGNTGSHIPRVEHSIEGPQLRKGPYNVFKSCNPGPSAQSE